MSACRLWIAAALALLALPAWSQSQKQGAVAQPDAIADKPLQVELVYPTNGQQFPVGSPVSLGASAWDEDDDIQQVGVLVDGVQVGASSGADYIGSWVITAGSHSVRARATNYHEPMKTAYSPTITITGVPNTLPSVSLTGPVDGSVYAPGATVPMTATASDPDGSISRVEFWVDNAKVGQDTSSPYAYNWPATVGPHSVLAKAVDSSSGVTSSSAISIRGNAAPTVSLGAPADGATFALGSAVTFSATAGDSDGTVSKVEFYLDNVLYATDTSSPYGQTWTATAGSHTVKAKAYDNDGGVSAFSSQSTISVNSPPTVSLTAPASGASVIAGSSVALAATASDSGGTVTKVEFFVDGSLVATDTSSPYTGSWTAAGTGSHSVKARATDNNGAAKDSTAASITVTGDPPPSVTLTSPANGATYTAGNPVTLSATASDNGSITKVEFYVDGSLVATDTGSPYSQAWTATTGSHTVKAKAYDNAGGSTFSGQAGITVDPPPNNPPSVTLTSPANGASFVSGSTVTLSATASDTDGTVAKVEFYVDGALVATDTSSPFGANWTASLGSHTILARATDDDLAGTDSTPAAITVAAPAVTIARHYFYNGYQELCRVEEPETGATLMGYDAAGNLAWSASGLPVGTACSSTGDASPISDRRVLRTYDARNRIATLTFPDANGNQSWDYTPDGLPESVTTWNDAGASSVVNSYAYNKRRLLTGESQASGATTWSVGYGYTANGHLATLVYPDSLTVAYAPNALGQATQAGSYATGVTYYPNGAIAGFTYGNGIVHTLTQNARGLPDRSRDLDGATPVHDDSYDYDAVGNVLAISDAVAGNRGDRDMGYDALNRLTSATSPMFGTASYTYDDVDNLVHVQVTGGSQPRNHDYFYDTTNRLTNIISDGGSDIGLGYDVQGNLANRNGTLYAFDYGNRMRSGGPETYRYDVQGRRVRSNSSAGLVYSLYTQSGQLLFQRDERSGKLRRYVSLGGSLVAESTTGLAGGTATVTYQHTDALGSPVATTNSAKAVLQRSEYEPYGYLLNRPMQDGPGYTGHVTDAATGLVYMQQRYYDPLIGERFLSVDPVTAYSPGGAFNQYWYANANPYRFTDPDGRDPDPGMDPYRLSGGFVGVRSPGPIACEECETSRQPSQSAPTSPSSTTSVSAEKKAPPVTTAELVAAGFKITVDANGTAVGLKEQFLAFGGKWRGSNGKLYDLSWGGNQYTGARSNVLEEVGRLKALGQGLFYVSSAISLGEGISAFRRGDGFGTVRAGVDVGWGAVGTTGPAGMVGAAAYQGTSLLIAIPAVNSKTVQPAADIMCSISGSC